MHVRHLDLMRQASHSLLLLLSAYSQGMHLARATRTIRQPRSMTALGSCCAREGEERAVLFATDVTTRHTIPTASAATGGNLLMAASQVLEDYCGAVGFPSVRRCNQPLKVGVSGVGRKSIARIAAHMADFQCFSIEITRTYGMILSACIERILLLMWCAKPSCPSGANDFKEDLKNIMNGVAKGGGCGCVFYNKMRRNNRAHVGNCAQAFVIASPRFELLVLIGWSAKAATAFTSPAPHAQLLLLDDSESCCTDL